MIQSTEIRKIARKTGLPAGLIEKDYANTLILKEVYQHSLTKDMLCSKAAQPSINCIFPQNGVFRKITRFNINKQKELKFNSYLLNISAL